MFKSTKNDGDKLAELEAELTAKRTAHDLAVSNFATTRDKADALADKVARAALTGDLDLQDLELELAAAERRSRAFPAPATRSALKFANLKRGSTTRRREAAARLRPHILKTLQTRSLPWLLTCDQAWPDCRRQWKAPRSRICSHSQS